MISSNDLRIGNLLLHKNGQIDRVTFGIIGQFDCSKKYANTIWSPIPLTEEWLVKFGWKLINDNRPDGIKVYEGEPYIYFKDGIADFSFHTYDIRHVHELQNLIYSTRKKELTIKL